MAALSAAVSSQKPRLALPARPAYFESVRLTLGDLRLVEPSCIAVWRSCSPTWHLAPAATQRHPYRAECPARRDQSHYQQALSADVHLPPRQQNSSQRFAERCPVKPTLRFVWQVIAVLFVISKLGNVFSVLTWAYVGASPLPKFHSPTWPHALSAAQLFHSLWHACTLHAMAQLQVEGGASQQVSAVQVATGI